LGAWLITNATAGISKFAGTWNGKQFCGDGW